MRLREQLKWYDAIDHVRWEIDFTADKADRWFFTEWFFALCRGWSLGELLVKAKKAREAKEAKKS